MEKFITSIKDLVIQALTNGSEVKAKAESGDALSCFQMGMIHLLGINTPIDFKKASKFLGNQSLSDVPDANRLLGFIAEYNGNYSQAFMNYANADKSKRPYIEKVFKERENLKAYLKRLNLPNTSLNEEVTGILNEIIEGGDSALDAKIKLAYICEDETTCLEAAQVMYETGNLFSAISLLKKGNIDSSNPLFVTIKNHYSKVEQSNLLPNSIEVIELEGVSFLTNYDSIPSFRDIKTLCNEASTSCMEEWSDMANAKINAFMQTFEKEEAARLKREKDAERKAREEEEKEKEKRRKKRKIDIVLLWFFGPLELLILIAYLINEKGTIFSNLIGIIIASAIFVVLPFMILRWLIRRIRKLN